MVCFDAVVPPDQQRWVGSNAAGVDEQKGIRVVELN
jgi:hypothetical protein